MTRLTSVRVDVAGDRCQPSQSSVVSSHARVATSRTDGGGAATILTVVVIDDDVFTCAFGAATRCNEEGEIIAIGDGRVTEGVPFTGNRYGECCTRSQWPHRARHV